MASLRERVRTILYFSDRNTAFDALTGKLRELQLELEEADKHEGRIVVKCLTEIVDVGSWRCWSDKLVFEFNAVHYKLTTVDVYAVPNPHRSKVSRKERVLKLASILAQIEDSNRLPDA